MGFKNVAVLDVGRQVKGKLRKLCPEGFFFVDRLHRGDGFKLHDEDTKLIISSK